MLVLAGVSLVVFVALTYVPGDAADSLLGESAAAGQLAALRQELGLEEPLPVCYARFVAGVVLHGDLGRSVVSGRAVSDLLAERIVPTAVLALTAIVLAVALGTTAGSLAATHPGSRLDLAVMGVSSLGMAVPTYWLSLLLVMLMFVAAWQGALGDALWFGQVRFAGFTLHPIVLFYALSGSLMVSRIRFPKL